MGTSGTRSKPRVTGAQYSKDGSHAIGAELFRGTEGALQAKGGVV